MNSQRSFVFDSTPPETMAYLAGVVDSDGYITIQRSKHASGVYFGPKVGIAGTRTQPHELTASLFGGKVSRHIPRNRRHRVQYQWSRSGRAAAAAIVALSPFLRVKKEQAEVALELHRAIDLDREMRLSDDPYPWFGPYYQATSRFNLLYEDMRDLNHPAGRLLDGREWNDYPEGATE